MLLNVHGLPTSNNHPKNHQFRQSITQWDIDVFLATEVNVNWGRVAYQHRLQEHCRGWWEAAKIVAAYNTTTVDEDPYQIGGTAIFAKNRAAHRVAQVGTDTEGLGRWTWITLQGKAGLTTRIISAYRPVLNHQGPLSVLSQQARHYLSQGCRTCPRTRYDSDLLGLLKPWTDAGDLIL